MHFTAPHFSSVKLEHEIKHPEISTEA